MDQDGRVSTLTARLAKGGVTNAERIAMRLADYPALSEHDEFLDEVVLAADPELAINTTLAWFDVADERLLSLWRDDAGMRARWWLIVGISEAIGAFLVKHPREILTISDASEWAKHVSRDVMVQRLLAAVGAELRDGRWVATADSTENLDALRIAYKREVLGIAARDVSDVHPLEYVAQELSSLADAVIEAALAISWAGINPGTPASRLAVIAMGKCGGRELNYVSDVDVIFVAEPFTAGSTGAIEEATRLASRLIQVCEEPTGEGMIWQVDPALRPEGKSGALVRTLDGHIAYYERWAETWEFQALLKAREMAGDAELGRQYVEALLPFVWAAAARPNFVEDVQAMRKRVVDNIPAHKQDRELKLGEGGLRDVEFAVQLLQLVHGRSDVMLRSSNTLQALEALATWGYVGREDASSLASAYRFERTLEHRIQMYQMRRTHIVPDNESDLRRIGRAMGMRNDPADSLVAAWQRHKLDTRRIHEKLFYRPLLRAVVRLDAADQRLTLDQAHDRLKALGFVDAESAMRHVTALSTGVSRRAAIQRTLLPVMLAWMAETPNPDAGLLAFRQVSDALGATPWYLRLLRDESVVAERMAYLLSVSRYFAGLLLSAPDAVALLADDESLQPRSRESLLGEMHAVVGRHELADDAVAAVRAIRQRELIRISAADLLGLIDVVEVCAALSDVADATLECSLSAVMQRFFWDRPPSLRIALIGLGRLGGRELNYGSDADVCFVYEPVDGSERAASDALSIVSSLQSLLTAPANDPAFPLDLDLRPEGKHGAVARTLDSYAAYYQRWSLTWESQALLRARAVAGDPKLGADFIGLIDSMRYPAGGLTAEELRDIRRIKARVEAERLPRGADPHTHVKLGPGGISDVEWTVQLLQLQHAHDMASLRHPDTLNVLTALGESGLMYATEAQTLRLAWLEASRIRNAIALTTGSPSDSIPKQAMSLKVLSFALKVANGATLIENYRRTARRARGVMQKYVYGIDD